MISINATLILQVIHIIILILILNRLMFRPLLGLTREREAYFNKAKDEVRELAEEAERIRTQFLKVQSDARKAASQEAAKIRAEGISQAEESISESREVVSSIRAEAEEDARKESEKTRVFLPDEAKGLADEITERLLGRRIAG